MSNAKKHLMQMDIPRFEPGRAMQIAGISERFSVDDTNGIATLWQRFRSGYDRIPHKIALKPVGIMKPAKAFGKFDYICGIEVSSFSALPPEFKQVNIPQQSYAVFLHNLPVTMLSFTYAAIKDYPPACNCAYVDGYWIERQLDTFDPSTGNGGIEIWVPVEFYSDTSS